MPHYHNFGWYYFLKYVVGFAGLLFLYSGFIKEKTFSCVCPSIDREFVRRKGENDCDNSNPSDEYCPTGGTTDACAKRADACVQSCVPADAENRYTYLPMPTTSLRGAMKIASSSKCLNENCRINENFQRRPTKISRSDGDKKIVECDNRGPVCIRYCRRSTNSIENPSSSSSTIVDRWKIVKSNYNDEKVYDAVTRANIRVRNSFAKRENLELEAFACLIFDRGIELRFENKIATDSSDGNFRRTDAREYEKIFSCDDRCAICREEESRRGWKNYRSESSSSCFDPVGTRSRNLPQLGSSSGSKCTIRFRRRSKILKCPYDRKIQKCRIIEGSDEFRNESLREELFANRRTNGNRRNLRYRPNCNCHL